MANDKLLAKLPPQNLEAESAVLGAILVNKEVMDKVADVLIAEDFYSQANQTIFRAILRLYEKRSPIDLVTLTNQLEGIKELDQIGGPAYLADLVNSVPTALHVVHYAEIVKNKSVLRRILSAGQKIAALGYDEDKDVQIIMDEAEAALFHVSRQAVADNFLPISDILAASFDRIDRLHREKGLLRGVTSGFKELDNKLSGFQPSDLIILAARPSMGKCVAGKTAILNPRTGSVQTVRDLVESERGEVVTLDKDWQLQPAKPERFVTDGMKPTYKVQTSSGRAIEATLPHPFLTITGWKHLVELKVGDRIAIAKKLPFFGRRKMLEHQIKALAYFIADGSLTQNSPGFTNVNPAIITDFKESMAGFGAYVRVRRKDSRGTRAPTFSAVVDREAYRGDRLAWSEKFRSYVSSNDQLVRQTLRQVGLSVTNIYSWQNATAQPGLAVATQIGQILEDFPRPDAFYRANPVTEFLTEHELMGKMAATKILPEAIFTLPKKQLALFLGRLFSCDGTAYVAISGGKPFPVIAYASISEQLIFQVQHLLTRFGIVAGVRRKRSKLKGKIFPSFELEIHGRDDLLLFCDEIGIFGKEAAVAKVRAEVAKHRSGFTKDTLPVDIWQIIDLYRGKRSWRSIAKELGLPESHNFHAYKRQPRRETVRRFAKVLKAPELDKLCDSDIYWDRITSIEPAGMQPVYDLTVADSHSFVANDFVVHNTTLALNFALNAAVKAKVPVGFFSMEQSREQIVDRLLCAQAMVDGWKLRTGNLSESDFPAIGMAMGTLAEAPIFIDDSPILTPIEIRTRARRLMAENKLGLIIVDYLQLLEGRRSYGENNRVQEVSDISRSLKAIARELNVPVIALSQLSRAVESREKKMPQLSDLRDSGSLEQDADVVMFLYREDYYDKETERRGIVDVLIRKHRNGPIGEVELLFKTEQARFYDIDRKKVQIKP